MDLAMSYSPCLLRKRSWCVSRLGFVDDLFPLPVEEKAVSWTLCAFAMAFSPCLSRKRAYHGLGVRLWCVFPFCLSRESPFQVSPATPQRGLEGTPKVARELPSQKTINFDYFRLLKSVDLSRVENTKKNGGAPDTRCSWTRRALAMTFSHCLSRERPSYGRGVLLRWPFPPACRGKGRLMDLVCARDGL